MALPNYGLVSLEQYRHIEEEDQVRYEYHEGHLMVMSGGSINHEAILDNIYGEIRSKLKARKSGCKTFGSGIKIEVTPGKRYVYADASVFCGDYDESSEFKDALKNPTVVIEVLSKSTSEYNRGLKGKLYRSIPSLRDYILITQTAPGVEHFSRSGDYPMYSYREYYDLGDVLEIESLGLTIPLSLIYEDVIFPDPKDIDLVRGKVYEPITPYGQP